MPGSPDHLPLLNKLLYASDMVGSQAIAQTRNLWLLFFLAPPREENMPSAVPALALGSLELDPRVLIAVVLTAGRLIEALDDPIIGWWSDRFRSRWGRRLPFVVFSTPFYALFFGLLWLTPAGGASFTNAIYIFVILELFFLSSTISGGPYEALLPEIARGHRDRMSIVAWQFYFGILGAVLGLVITGLIQDALGFKVMGVVVGLSGLAFRYLGLKGIWRHAPSTTLLAIGCGAATRFGSGFGRLQPYLPDSGEVRWWSLKWDPVRRQIWRRSFSRMHPWYREGKAGMRWSVTPPVSWLTFLVRQPRTWAEG